MLDWSTDPGPARLRDAGWQAVQIGSAPSSSLVANAMPPLRVTRTVPP